MDFSTMQQYTIKKQLASILLIDDDEATNFMHRLLIEKTNIARQVEFLTDGRAGIDHLTRLAAATDTHFPDLIFLDINMPVMDGWQFLKAYRMQFGATDNSTIICMLSTALPDHLKRKYREEIELITRFINKPLTEQTLLETIAHFYPGHVELKGEI